MVYVCAIAGTHDSKVHAAVDRAALANIVSKSVLMSQLNDVGVEKD